MRLDHDFEELDTLRSALDRALTTMESELAHTEAPPLQHELAADYERLRRLREVINLQSMPYSPPERVSDYSGL